MVEGEALDLVTNAVELPGVVDLEGFLEAVRLDCAATVRLASVVLREPAIDWRNVIEVLDESLVVVARLPAEKVAHAQDLGPRGSVVGDHSVAPLGQGLGYAR